MMYYLYIYGICTSPMNTVLLSAIYGVKLGSRIMVLKSFLYAHRVVVHYFSFDDNSG